MNDIDRKVHSFYGSQSCDVCKSDVESEKREGNIYVCDNCHDQNKEENND